MKKRGLLLFNEISDRGGIEVFSKTFLESLIRLIDNPNLNIILLNHNVLPDINIADQRSKRLKFFFCNSNFKIIKKIKCITFFIYNVMFRKPDFIISNHLWFLRMYWFIRPLLKIDYGFIVYGIETWKLNFIDKSIVIQRIE